MTKEEFKRRTFDFGQRVVRFVRALPREMTTDVCGRQLVRSATSVGANYRAVCRARSKADAIAKFGLVEEETDECIYWLEFIKAANSIESSELSALVRESNEILAMSVASINTMRGRNRT